MSMRQLAVVEKYILDVLRKAPVELNYVVIHAKLAKLPGMATLSASRVMTHLQRLQSLGLITSRLEEAPKTPGARLRNLYKIRMVAEPKP